MDRDTAHRSWQSLSCRIKRRWDRLSDVELTRAEGDREYLLRKLHEHYGLARDEIDLELSLLGVSEALAPAGRAAPLDQPRLRGMERRRGGERRS